ncbi:putative UPF0481 protein, partial [Tanacetum coccineum]
MLISSLATKFGIIETEIDVEHDVVIEVKDDKEKEDTFAKKSDLKRFMNFVTKILSKSNARLVREGEETTEDESDESKAPRIKEFTIPSVTEMTQAGIKMSPVNGGISDITYEACVAAGPLVVTRYTELMNGIINTEEDATFLRERGIVVNQLKSDQEVANLWNGMSKSVKLTKVPKMDKVIEDVNKRFARTWRVKMANFMKTYVFRSWKFLTVLATVGMLLLTMLQSFCFVYSCARVFHQFSDIQGSERTKNVDSIAFLASFPWHTGKNVSRDPFPMSTEFNADDYVVLVAHPAPFWKFPEPFLCLVGMSYYYTLDEDTYPRLLHDDGEGGCLSLYIVCPVVFDLAIDCLFVYAEMDLSAFIHVVDPTKVKVV